MTISIELPDKFAHQLELDGQDKERRAVEMFALEAYRKARISQGQVGELLGLGFHETEVFLKENGVELLYGPEELREDLAGLERLFQK